MNVEMPAPAAPRAVGAGAGAGVVGAGAAKGGSDALDLVALALTVFLVIWQICLLSVASRVLHIVKRDISILNGIIFI